MICRFWCLAHESYHFLRSEGDDTRTAPCLELGEQDCADFLSLQCTGIITVDASDNEIVASKSAVARAEQLARYGQR